MEDNLQAESPVIKTEINSELKLETPDSMENSLQAESNDAETKSPMIKIFKTEVKTETPDPTENMKMNAQLIMENSALGCKKKCTNILCDCLDDFGCMVVSDGCDFVGNIILKSLKESDKISMELFVDISNLDFLGSGKKDEITMAFSVTSSNGSVYYGKFYIAYEEKWNGWDADETLTFWYQLIMPYNILKLKYDLKHETKFGEITKFKSEKYGSKDCGSQNEKKDIVIDKAGSLTGKIMVEFDGDKKQKFSEFFRTPSWYTWKH